MARGQVPPHSSGSEADTQKLSMKYILVEHRAGNQILKTRLCAHRKTSMCFHVDKNNTNIRLWMDALDNINITYSLGFGPGDFVHAHKKREKSF